jgi:hypothetical protein
VDDMLRILHHNDGLRYRRVKMNSKKLVVEFVTVFAAALVTVVYSSIGEVQRPAISLLVRP